MKWMVLLLSSISFTAACAAPLTFEYPGKAIVLPQDTEQFEVVLNSNPSTGYSWFLMNYDSLLLKPIEEKYIANTDKKRIGAPGKDVWTFMVLPGAYIVPRATTLAFEYVRPWENTQPVSTVISVRFS